MPHGHKRHYEDNDDPVWERMTRRAWKRGLAGPVHAVPSSVAATPVPSPTLANSVGSTGPSLNSLGQANSEPDFEQPRANSTEDDSQVNTQSVGLPLDDLTDGEYGEGELWQSEGKGEEGSEGSEEDEEEREGSGSDGEEEGDRRREAENELIQADADPGSVSFGGATEALGPLTSTRYRMGDRAHLLNQARFSTQVSRRVFDALKHWPGLQIPGDLAFESSDVVNRALQKLAPLQIKEFDCCEHGCLAYTGHYQDWEFNWSCGRCGKPRRKNGPFKFTYISPLNRIRALFENRLLRKKLNYRTARNNESDKIQDVWDGQQYHNMRKREVFWGGTVHEPKHCYFNAATDIGLGFSTDGVPLHNRTGLDAWPLVLTLYSLPPEMRYKQEFQICCGLVPGTKNDKDGKVDFDSFLQPLIEDLKVLASMFT